MNDSPDNISSPTPSPEKKGLGKRIAKWAAVSVASIIALIGLFLCGLTLFMTPDRLTNLINTRASEYFNADVTTHNARFTLWSTFPRFCIEIDSVRITSKALDLLPAETKRSLPADYRNLAWCGEIKGGINLMSLLAGRIRLHDVSTEGFSLNLVSVNDSTANFLILPPEGLSVPKIPHIAANSIVMKNPGAVTLFSLESGLQGSLDMNGLSLKEHHHSDNYSLKCNGTVSAIYESLKILDGFPFSLDGDIDLKFKPLSLRLSDYKIALGNLHTSTGLRVTAGDNPNMDYFDFSTESFSLMKFLEYLPGKLVGNISDIDINPMVRLSARLLKPYHFSSSALPTLEIKCSADEGSVTYRLADGQNLSVSHSDMDAMFYFDGENPAASTLSIPNLKIAGEGIDCSLSAVVSRLTTTPVVEASLNASSSLKNLAQWMPQAKNFNISGNLDSDVAVRFSLPSLTSFQPDSIEVKGDVKLEKLALSNRNMNFRMADLNLSFALSENKNPGKPFSGKPKYADSRSLSLLSHSPASVSVSLPDSAKAWLRRINYNVELSTGAARLTLRHYPDPLLFGESRLELDNDLISLKNFRFRSGPSALALNGTVSGLRNFLTGTSGSVAPLGMMLNIKIDTLDINSLAKAYEDAVIAATGHAPTPAENIKAVPSDSVALLIPRNINARILASAKKTLWTNLDFRNLRADISVADGNADIRNLTMTTSFANVAAGVRYYSANIQNLDLGADLNISQIDMKHVYSKFPSLVAAMPQITNFSGIFGASGKINAEIYPDMAFDMSSLNADLNLSGRQLNLKQNKFIHRIVRMLGIRNHDTIHIENLDVHAYVHDNLLELYPFIFGFDRYRIQLAGVNNFAGDLDYHIGVLKSPVPIHFGIEIGGNYSHPKLGFGKAEWNDKRSAKISSEVEQSFSFNLVKEMRKYMTMFIHKAATSQQSANTSH